MGALDRLIAENYAELVPSTPALSRLSAEIFVPDAAPPEVALSRTTHVGVGAHPDDLEILAATAIVECHGASERFFTGIVVADGAGGPRSPEHAELSELALKEIRRAEQRRAAALGRYSAVVMLDHPSRDVKDASARAVTDDLTTLLRVTRPRELLTHALTDRHDTHVAVALRVVEACRALPEAERPARILGAEVWRDLDWLTGGDRIELAADEGEALQAELLAAFESQNGGTRRYELGTLGRRRAQASFAESHESEPRERVVLAMDLAPLVAGETTASGLVRDAIDHFRADVVARLARVGGGVT
jgi:LmbE family N-acetylglucosaminyl deacetylase